MQSLTRPFVIFLTLLGLAFVATALATAFLSGGWVAGGPILGVLVGTAAATIPTVLREWTKRRDEIRVAALLWRDDFHEFQDVIARSLKDGKWHDIQAPRISDDKSLALIAEGLKTWRNWNPVINARRGMVRVAEQKESGTPFLDAVPAVEKAWNAVNAAKPLLAKLDGGPSTPHGQDDQVQRTINELRGK